MGNRSFIASEIGRLKDRYKDRFCPDGPTLMLFLDKLERYPIDAIKNGVSKLLMDNPAIAPGISEIEHYVKKNLPRKLKNNSQKKIDIASFEVGYAKQFGAKKRWIRKGVYEWVRDWSKCTDSQASESSD